MYECHWTLLLDLQPSGLYANTWC